MDKICDTNPFVKIYDDSVLYFKENFVCVFVCGGGGGGVNNILISYSPQTLGKGFGYPLSQNWYACNRILWVTVAKADHLWKPNWQLDKMNTVIFTVTCY